MLGKLAEIAVELLIPVGNTRCFGKILDLVDIGTAQTATVTLLQGHHIVVRGPRQLRGTTVRSTDLRAGAALVLAGLVAEGETIVTDPYHIDRGYAEFLSKLRHLGADLDRVNDAVGDLPAGT